MQNYGKGAAFKSLDKIKGDNHKMIARMHDIVKLFKSCTLFSQLVQIPILVQYFTRPHAKGGKFFIHNSYYSKTTLMIS